jgi:hypothetical protein
MADSDAKQSDESLGNTPGGSARSLQADAEDDRHDASAPAANPAESLIAATETRDVGDLTKEAFGMMIASCLSSPKWDRRMEAINGIVSMIKSHGLANASPDGRADRQAQIIAAMRLLEQVLRDKVFPMVQAALNLYHVVLLHIDVLPQIDRDAGVDFLLPVIASRLGDSNPRVHEAAEAEVLATAEFGPSPDSRLVCFKVLSAALTREKSVARVNGILACILRLVRQQGCSAEDADIVAAGLPVALEHSKEQVRLNAVDVVAEYAQAGVELPVQLRPALEEILHARVAMLEDEGEGEEIVSGLDFTVVGTRAPMHCVAPVADDLDFADDEEHLMDTILGDTGLAFQKSGLVSLDSCAEPARGLSDVDALEAEFLQELQDLGSLSP